MKHTIKDDCAHAYVAIALLLAIFVVLFVADLHGQELPNAPQAVVRQQIPPVHKQGPLPIKPGGLCPGSADGFREPEHFRLPRVILLFTHIDWNLSFGKPKEAGHFSRVFDARPPSPLPYGAGTIAPDPIALVGVRP
jgi:hypothetical protein